MPHHKHQAVLLQKLRVRHAQIAQKLGSCPFGKAEIASVIDNPCRVGILEIYAQPVTMPSRSVRQALRLHHSSSSSSARDCAKRSSSSCARGGGGSPRWRHPISPSTRPRL